MNRAIALACAVAATAACASSKDPVEASACGNVEKPATAPKTLDRLFRGFAAGIASDGTSIYYTGPYEATLLRIANGGGAKPEVVQVTQDIRRVVGHGTRVCWLDRVRIACLVGDGPAYEIARPAPGTTIVDVDFDDTSVYWLEQGPDRPRAMVRAPIDRSSPPTVLFAIDGGWRSLTIDAGHILFAADPENTVSVCDTADGCGRRVALESYGNAAGTSVGRMAVDARFAYVPVQLTPPGQRDAGKVRRLALDGSGKVDDLALCTDEAPVVVTVDATTAYVLTRGADADAQAPVGQPRPGCDGSVFAVPLAGGVTRRLAREQRCPWNLTLAPGKVAWSNARDGEGELLVLPR